MNTITITKKDEITMRLVHYFITEKNYTPIVVKGVKDEIWLENQEEVYKIVRINSNYIHNNEQLESDIYKLKNVIHQIKRKTLSFTMNALNILLDVNEDVRVDSDKTIKNVYLKNIDETKNTLIAELFPGIENKLLIDQAGIELILNVTQDINAKTEKNNRIYEAIFKNKKIVVTYVLIAICAIMYLISILAGGTDALTLYKLGAVAPAAIKSGEIWRLLTGTFLHGGLIHLLVNMYSLFIIGTQLETYLGKGKFLTVYLVSAISGSLMSSLFTNAISVGASGAIFGLLGSLLYFGYHFRLYLGTVLKTQIIPLIILNLFIGFTLPGIDNAAHIGGLIGGLLASMATGINGKTTKAEKTNGLIVLVIYIAFLSFMLFR